MDNYTPKPYTPAGDKFVPKTTGTDYKKPFDGNKTIDNTKVPYSAPKPAPFSSPKPAPFSR